MRAVVLFLAAFSTKSSAQNATRVMLDSIARMVDGSVSGVDDNYFNKLVGCMQQASNVPGAPNLVESHDAAWSGFQSYFMTNGTSTDGWGACDAAAGCKMYAESNLTALDVDGIGIYEPCNSVSNMAYYRTGMGICAHTGWAMDESAQSALVQAYVALAMGSFFWHGSHSFLGNVADNRLIDVLAFVSYQVSIDNFLDYSSNATQATVLRDLQSTPRSASAVNSTYALTDMFMDMPIDEWQQYINDLDMPNYYLTFAALVGNVLNLLLPEAATDTIFDAMAEAFDLPQEDYDFMVHNFFPALRASTASKNLVLNQLEKVTLGLKFSGTLVKMLYAFLWQEWVFVFGPKGELMLRPRMNELGATLMPGVNTLANMLTGYVHTDPSVQDCVGTYPADNRCRAQEAHSKWHEENGNGLLDLMFLSDDIYSATSSPAQRKQHQVRRTAAAAASKRNEQRQMQGEQENVGGGGGYAAFAVSTVKGYKLYVASLLGLD